MGGCSRAATKGEGGERSLVSISCLCKKCGGAARPDRATNKSLRPLFKQTHKNTTTSARYPVNSKNNPVLEGMSKNVCKHSRNGRTTGANERTWPRSPRVSELCLRSAARIAGRTSPHPNPENCTGSRRSESDQKSS